MATLSERDPLVGLVLNVGATVSDAIKRIASDSVQMAFVVDSEGLLLGIVTQGDVRRHVSAGGGVDDPVTACMNRAFKSVGPGASKAELKWRFGAVSVLPRIDSQGRLIEVLTRDVHAPVPSEASPPPSLYDILWKRAAISSADYVQSRLGSAMLFKDQEDVWRHALSKAGRDGLFAEFGVFSGASINFFASAIQYDQKTIFGFDSFEGLKEDWFGHECQAGVFDLGGRAPEVLANVILVKGWFDDTLPRFLADHPGHFSFVHLDADTFASTDAVLKLIGPRLASGTVIVFDEYLGFPNWQDGEHLAWQTCVRDLGIRYQYLAFSPFQAAVQVL